MCTRPTDRVCDRVRLAGDCVRRVRLAGGRDIHNADNLLRRRTGQGASSSSPPSPSSSTARAALAGLTALTQRTLRPASRFE